MARGGASGKVAAAVLRGAIRGWPMRLSKHISDAGVCSRREADQLSAEGRVTVNGLRARVGAEVGEGDEVRIDGRAVNPVPFLQASSTFIAMQRGAGGTDAIGGPVGGSR